MGMGCPADSSWRTQPREELGAAGQSIVSRMAPFSGGLSTEHVLCSQGDKPAPEVAERKNGFEASTVKAPVFPVVMYDVRVGP